LARFDSFRGGAPESAPELVEFSFASLTIGVGSSSDLLPSVAFVAPWCAPTVSHRYHLHVGMAERSTFLAGQCANLDNRTRVEPSAPVIESRSDAD
jgi:hypothetical protein